MNHESTNLATGPSIFIASGVATVMLLVALAPGLPYGYYTLLRWVCCTVFVLLAYLAWSSKKSVGTWVLGFFALLFNPLVPVYLGREVWVVLDVIAAVVIAGATWFLYSIGTKRQDQEVK